MSNPRKWTNDSLDKHLQERGFIKDNNPIDEGLDYKAYKYNRLTDVVYARFYNINLEPKLHALVGEAYEEVDPMDIGYRNLEVQNDGSSDE